MRIYIPSELNVSQKFSPTILIVGRHTMMNLVHIHFKAISINVEREFNDNKYYTEVFLEKKSEK